MKRIVFISAFAVLCVAATACGNGRAGAGRTAAARPSDWAVPVHAEHVENLHMVDTGIYRCAQPSRRGFAELYGKGVREILNLRNYHGDERKTREIPLTLHRVKMNAGDSDTESFVEALRIIRDRRGPIAIHCLHGSDRTGAVVALYRMAFQGWTARRAVDELIGGGYGYHRYYANIPEYILSVDVERLREALSGGK